MLLLICNGFVGIAWTRNYILNDGVGYISNKVGGGPTGIAAVSTEGYGTLMRVWYLHNNSVVIKGYGGLGG